MNAACRDESVSLRVSVTDRCQLRCPYCMPPGGVEICDHRDLLRFEDIVHFVRLIKSRFGLSKVHLTGGEPLLRRGLADLVVMLAEEGVNDLAMTTNAQSLASHAGELKRAGLSRVNVSLDSLDEQTFAALTRGGKLQDTLDGIDAALNAGLTPVKLNTVVMRGHNHEQVADMAMWAIQRGCHIRFLELMPIGCAKDSFKDRFVPESQTMERLSKALSLKPCLSPAHGPVSRSSRNFAATDPQGRKGTVGFITSQTRPFCDGCRRLRLTSTGQLITCLARGDGLSVKALLGQNSERGDRELLRLVARELDSKQAHAGFTTPHAMASVGG